ncbi:MAG: M14 family metallopeptidase [Candidatus Methanomethylicaceae archaeon]
MNSERAEVGRILGIDFSRYYTPDEVEKILYNLTEKFDNFCSLHCIGRTLQGRSILVLELTNKSTGSAEDKPGEVVFGCIHAAEVMSAMAALYLICEALDSYNRDDMIKKVLDETVLYVIPYLNPDGAHIALTTPYRWVGNGRYSPGQEQPWPGLYQCDVNGDGMILEMRIEDPAGEWKVSEADPRLLVPREPGDQKGPFYRRLPEGLIRDWDGAELWLPKPRDGNLNRNFPENWAPEVVQHGAGAYPLSEPEAAAFANFILNHPNVFGAISLHTNAGAILFPSLDTSRKRDFLAFHRLAQAGAKITGYRIVESVLEQFTIDKSKPRRGLAEEWLYKQRGIICFTVELWDLLKVAGVQDYSLLSVLTWFTPEQELALLKWNDEVLAGEGFVDWTPFDHPQLGRVEIGGWKYLWPIRNAPPGKLLVEEISRLAKFVFVKCASRPLLKILQTSVCKLGRDIYKVEAIIGNEGFLPSYVTEVAREQNIADTVHVSLHFHGVGVVLDNTERDLGHLAGWSERTAPWVPWNYLEWEPTRRKATWLVHTQPGATATIVAWSQRAGKAAVNIVF